MRKKPDPDTDAKALCEAFGYRLDELRTLWIHVRQGDEEAKVQLHRLLLEHHELHPVFKFLQAETKEIRSSIGKKNPKYFGNLTGAARPAWSKIQSSRVEGVDTIHQGGLPSLGKRR